MTQQTLVGQGHNIIETSRSLSDSSHSLQFLDKEMARCRDHYLKRHNIEKRQTSLSQKGFEPAVPKNKLPLTHTHTHTHTHTP